ncbi:ABC transporter permease [Streptomyces sp. NPDC006385]|uniref:ABC transporter permease n=1 Tax=Streptomyces sp. NPDC006385 TaxID=3156761 RepID=UPI0033BC7D7A
MHDAPGRWLRPTAFLIGLFMFAPTLVVVPMSLSAGNRLQFPPDGLSTRWYTAFFSDPVWVHAVISSVQVGLLTTVVSTVLGTATAIGVVRGRLPGKGLINALMLSPIIMPVVVFAISLFFVFSRWQLIGSTWGLVLAHTVLALPLVIVSVSAGLQRMDPRLERAARSLGARPWTVLRRVTLPLLLPGITTGALFAFATSWDEVVSAIFLTSPQNRTLPVVMWEQVTTQLDPTLAVAATLVMVTTVVLLVGAALAQARLKKGRTT